VLRVFLIADVRGFTSYTREQGDEAGAHLAMRFAELAREAVAARGSQVIDLRGDEAFAVFESASQAVRAALELQSACREEMAASPGLPLNVGIGLDAGEPVAVEDGYRGGAVNMAARFCSAAAAGEVLVSRSVAGLAGGARGEFSFEERGTATFKGIEQPVEVLAAVAPPSPLWAQAPPSDLPAELDISTPLAGRTDELHWLRGTWRLVPRGRGRVIFLSGPPGIGKTRLAAELASWASSGADVLVAAGGGAARAEVSAAVKAAAEATRPTLVVLDDLDPVADAAGSELAAAFEAIAERPSLVLALAREPGAVPALAALLERADRIRDGHRRLSPLDRTAVEQIAHLYAGDELEDVPIATILRATKGVPALVHEALAGWAGNEAARRLEAAAESLAEGRGKRAADLEFANNVIRMRLDRMYEAAESTDGGDVCPYKGLEPFDESDAASFFGRENLVGELAARTAGSGLLAVVGASGTGKSSAVCAGLLPSLAAGVLPGSGRWRNSVIRPGEHPLEALVAVDEGGEERIVFVVDQFEEVFTACEDEGERSEFISALVQLAGEPDRHAVVVTIRDDFYGRCAAYTELAALLGANHVLVAPMSRDELRRAIELPARRSGVRFESALIDTLVEETADEPGGLPLLSTALVELWESRKAGWIRLEAHERSGGVRGAVARLAEESYSKLDGPAREKAEPVLLRLATDDGETVTRRRIPRSELELDRDPVAAAVIARFTNDRLLTTSDSTVEVAHEALLREWPRLRDWLDEDAEGRRLRLHLTETARVWDESGREPSELYRGARLSAALDWASRHGRALNQLEQEFLGASREAGEREAARQRVINRRLRGLLAGAAVFLVLAIVAGAVAFAQRDHARRSAAAAARSATAALAQRLGAQALTVTPPDQSFLYARESYNLEPSAATRGYLFAAQVRSPAALAVVMPVNERIRAMLASPDFTRQLVLSDRNEGAVLDSATLDTEATFNIAGGSVLAWAGSDKLLYTDAAIGKTGFLDVRTGRFRPDPRIPADAYSLSGDGKLLFTLPLSGKEIVVYDRATMRLERRMLPPPGRVFYDVEPEQGGSTLAVEVPADTSSSAPTQYAIWLHDFAGAPSIVISGAADLPPFVPYSVGGGRFAVPWTKGVKLVDLSNGRSSLIDPDLGEISALGLSPDGTRLVIATVAHSGVTVVSLPDGTPVDTFVGHQSQLHGVSFNPSGSIVYTGGADGRLIAWDLRGSRSLATTTVLPGPSPPANGGPTARLVAASPDGRLVAAVQGDGKVQIADGLASDLPAVRSLTVAAPSAHGQPYSVAFDAHGRRLAVGTDDGHVLVYDTASWKIVARLSVRPLPHAQPSIASLAFASDGTLAAGVADGRIVRFSGAGLRAEPPIAAASAGSGGGAPLAAIAYSPNRKLLAAAVTPASTGQVAVFDASTGKRLYVVPAGSDATAVTFTPDGTTLVTGDADGLASFWTAATGARDGAPVRADQGGVGSLAVDSTGRTLATAGTDGATWLFDLASRTQVGTPLGADPSTATAALFLGPGDGSPLALAVASDGSPGTLTRWNLRASFLAARACLVARRNLTRLEWEQILPSLPYAKVCPQYPIPAGTP
jgi:WD40 repeat protein/class 3 adenylate cyclase